MKNPHAVALGKLGGAAGTGAAKARTSEQARAAVQKRWYRQRNKPVTAEYLLSQSDQSGGQDACWPWLKGCFSSGYGEIKIHGKMMHVTRVLWNLLYGVTLKADEYILHRCDNPPCINPKHLFVGTHADNMADKAAKGRHHGSKMTHCKHGHEFTEENTYRVGNHRHCQTCKRQRGRAQYEKMHPNARVNHTKHFHLTDFSHTSPIGVSPNGSPA